MLEKTVYFVKNCLINISGTFNKKLGYFLLKQPGHTGSIFGSADADGNDAQTSSPPSYENILPARNIRCSSKVKFHKKNRDFFGFKEQNKKNII